MKDCIFYKIVAEESPSYRVWEDEKHLAFLSIFPNTEKGMVVIPKEHISSYLFDQTDSVITDMVLAAKKVASLLE